MALHGPKLYSENAWMVGDGNSSFTLCLASALSCIHRLKSSQPLCNQALSFAVENIAKLSEFENLETFHDFLME